MDGRGLEFIGGEYGGGVGGAGGCDECEVRFGFVGGFHADVHAGDGEAGRVGARGGYVFGFGGRDGGVHGGGVGAGEDFGEGAEGFGHAGRELVILLGCRLLETSSRGGVRGRDQPSGEISCCSALDFAHKGG